MNSQKGRVRALCLTLALTIVLLVTSSLAVFAQDTPPSDNLSASADTAATSIAYGAHLRPVFIDYGNGTWYSNGDEVMAFNNLVGKDLAVVAFFASWSAFDPFLLDDIQNKVPADRRPAIMLAWEPSSNSTGCDLGYGGDGPLNAINSGRCDGFIRNYALSLKPRPERFILRLAHEMNIADAGWWPGHYGLDAGAYVAMFQRVRNIFREEGANNVEFMWSPNSASNPPDAWNNIHNYYPGNAYVDWIGLSGYNWSSQPWRSFESMYDGILRDLACRYAKPVIISEIGSVDQDGNDSGKANWIADAYTKLPNYPFVRGIVWFNDFAYGSRGNADFRVTTGAADCRDNGDCSGVQRLPGSSGGQATDAYVRSIRTSTYTNRLPTLAQATPASSVCSNPNPSQPFTLSCSTVVLRPGASSTVTLQASGLSTATPVTLVLPTGVQGTASPATLNPPGGTSNIRLTADRSMKPGSCTVTVRVGSTSLSIKVITANGQAFVPFLRH